MIFQFALLEVLVFREENYSSQFKECDFKKPIYKTTNYLRNLNFASMTYKFLYLICIVFKC